MPQRPSQRLHLVRDLPPFLRRRDDFLVARRKQRKDFAFNLALVAAVVLLVVTLAAHAHA